LVGKKKHTDDISLDIMGNPHEMRGGWEVALKYNTP
jgi:hypothetical protein